MRDNYGIDQLHCDAWIAYNKETKLFHTESLGKKTIRLQVDVNKVFESWGYYK